MPRINISRDTLKRLRAFQDLGEQLAGEPMTLELCAESLMALGMRAILDGLWKPHEPDTLIETLQKLAARCPEQVYPFLAEVLKTGEQIRQESEKEAPVFGFRQ
ncbi:MAG TPA: hypothetical protein VE988_28780 [Gemmataceae bacterium]|nr:hypothetical protein [Gemmataceae bacterium]